MNIQKLKSIVNDLESNYNLVSSSDTATADLLVMFAMSLDKWMVDAVKSLDGDTSFVLRNNETVLEMALSEKLAFHDDGQYVCDYITEIPVR